ncbi:MAG TPA: hypothetical protein VD765_07970, partial [Solirubrobacterales bacterium]|nr:hypothetical protein [Solirubrobacterales bacterium]
MRVGIGAACACAALLAVAPSAHAFELENVTAAPASNQAGANADLTLSFEVIEPEADLRDLTIHLPPGLIGNPRAASMCTESELSADNCPAGSAVGTVVNDLEVDLVVPIPLSVSGTVYNVVPRAGEPARFGIVLDPLPIPLPGNPLFPKIIVQSAATLRPSDLGLDTILNGLPNTATVAGIPTQINITSLSLTLDGTAPSGQGFIRLPTSCKTHNVGFDAAAYDGQTATANAQFATSNCGALPFTPELSARVKRVGAVNDPIELSTTIAQTIEEAGLRRAQVVLPAGIGGNNDVLSNQCSQADFLAETCPAASLVGFASATSPLLS